MRKSLNAKNRLLFDMTVGLRIKGMWDKEFRGNFGSYSVHTYKMECIQFVDIIFNES